MVCRDVYIPQDDDSMVPDPQSNGHWCKTYQPHDLNDLVWQSSGWTLVGVLGSYLVNQIGCFKTWTFKQNMRFESTKWRETTETTANFFFHRGWGYQVISRLEPFGYGTTGTEQSWTKGWWSESCRPQALIHCSNDDSHTHNCVQRHAKIDIFFTFYNVYIYINIVIVCDKYLPLTFSHWSH
jgi:hypothetical protein